MHKPVLLAEVLSRSSARTDLEEKPREFLTIPTLEAYLVLEQQEAKAWLWSREAGSFVPKPQEIVGRNEVVQISALDLSLPLTEIYAGLTFGTDLP